MSAEDHGGESPCMAPLIVGGHAVDPATARDVARFRKAERARLLAARHRAVSDREAATRALRVGLDGLVTPRPGLRIAVYWPIRGEPDLRGWMAEADAAGAEILLPVVERKAAPLAFLRWRPGCAMLRGFWNIPVPASGSAVVPDIVISPLVGADAACFRLGNGGGYYDRTLASLAAKPHCIGVGFSGCLIPSIHPMPWDIPMDALLLSDGSRIIR